MGLKKCLVLVAVFYFSILTCDAQSAIAELSQKFNSYQVAWPGIKLHLIFNQNKFSPGDTAWFKAYFLKEDLTRIEGKHLVDVNLVNRHGQIAHHLIFQVSDGLGQNQIAIPDSLSAGIYLVTAHTSLMSQVDPSFIFKKEITIVKQNTIVNSDQSPPKVKIEGGHLIRAISNKVVIQTPKSGSRFRVVDASGKEINQGTTDAQGVASFILNPSRNMAYSIKVDEGVAGIPLPATEDDGCGIILTSNMEDKSVKMQFASPPGSAFRKEELIVMVTVSGKIYYSRSFNQGENDFAELQIPMLDLPKGVAHVSLLTQSGKLLGSRDFYCYSTDQVQGSIQITKNYFHPGEKVSFEVSVTNNGQPVEGEFSVRVLNAELFNSGQQSSIYDELYIPAEMAGEITTNRYDSLTLSSLDNFLILYSKDFPWQKIMSSETSSQKLQSASIIEKRGAAYFTDTHLPVPDFTQILVYLQKNKIHRETLAQGNGNFWISLPEFLGQDEFFYLARIQGSDEIFNVDVKWEGESVKLTQAPHSKEIESPDKYATFATKKRLIDQSFRIESSSSDSTSIPLNDFETVIATADITKNVQDYILFPTMDELLKEVVPAVFQRKTKTKSIVRVQLIPPMRPTDDPVYIIDGIATKNTPFFLSLKPADLKTIKVIRAPKKLYPLGLLGKNGIIIVQTRKGDVRDQPIDPDKRVEGINEFVNFDSSINAGLKRPDFRSTIYWNPSLKTDSKGKATVEFVCSSDVGKFHINVSGITSSGEPFSKDQEIEVGIVPEKK